MARGDGRVFQRGSRWWISYYANGKERRESAGQTEDQARKKLRQRLGEVASGRYVPPAMANLTIAELMEAYLTNRSVVGKRGLRTLRTVKGRITHYVGDWRVTEVNLPRLETWAAKLMANGYARGTVKMWLAYLQAAFRIGRRLQLVATVPDFPILEAGAPRQGFFEPEHFEAVRRALPEPLSDIALFAYLTGWRKGEILGLTWADVDRQGSEIRLVGERTKNGRPRLMPITGELVALIERRWKARKVGDSLCEWVFHRYGEPVKDFYDAWANACVAAGVGPRIFHDLRRTAVRDMVNAGVSERVAMENSGHQSRTIFQRYHIVSAADQVSALAKVAAHRAAVLGTRTVTRTLGAAGQGNG